MGVFYENGVLRQEEYYDMDLPIGIFRDYHNNGKVKVKSMWLNGKKQGVWPFYEADGSFIRTEFIWIMKKNQAPTIKIECTSLGKSLALKTQNKKSMTTKSTFPKTAILSLILSLPLVGFTQKSISMADTETRREISMEDASGKSSEGIYRYYAKGDNKPFTGILFAKYANGNYSTWQEFEDGVGQGKWINYYENGNYKEVGYYNNNLVEGPIKKYYEDGNLKSEGNYKDWRVKIGT